MSARKYTERVGEIYRTFDCQASDGLSGRLRPNSLARAHGLGSRVFSGFPVSIRIMSRVWDLQTESLGQKLLLLALADNANDAGVCWPSIPTICRKCQCSERTAQGHVKRMEKLGWLKIKLRKGHSSLYTLTVPITPAESAPRKICPVPPAESAPPPPQNLRPEPSVEPSVKHQGEAPPGFKSGKRRKFPNEALKAIPILKDKIQHLKENGIRGIDGKLIESELSELRRLRETLAKNENIACEA